MKIQDDMHGCINVAVAGAKELPKPEPEFNVDVNISEDFEKMNINWKDKLVDFVFKLVFFAGTAGVAFYLTWYIAPILKPPVLPDMTGYALCAESAGGGPFDMLFVPQGRKIKVVNPGEGHTAIIQYFESEDAGNPKPEEKIPTHQNIYFTAYKEYFYFTGHCTIDNNDKHAPIRLLVKVSNIKGEFDFITDIPQCKPLHAKCNPDS